MTLYRRPLLSIFLIPFLAVAHADEPAAKTEPPAGPDPADVAKAAAEIPKDLQEALARLDLPGVKINIEKWAVDVDATICLQHGLLELIACTKDSKEHESIVAINAKPSHIHTALLLLGAVPGNPAIQRMIEEDGEIRFLHLPPRGHQIDVYLLFEDDKTRERPISEFIIAADHEDYSGAPEPEEKSEPEKFPSHTFVFAGSHLVGEGDAPKQYLADLSGHVITLATFGDELLCLPGFFEHANEALMWQAHGDVLPPIDTKVTLRLRPHRKIEAPAE